MPSVFQAPYEQYTKVVDNLSLASGLTTCLIPYDVTTIDEIRMIGVLYPIGATLTTTGLYLDETYSSGLASSKYSHGYGSRSTAAAAYLSASFIQQVTVTRNTAFSDWQGVRFDVTVKRDNIAADLLKFSGQYYQFGTTSSTYYLSFYNNGLLFLSNPNITGFRYQFDAGTTFGTGSKVSIYRNNYPIESD